MAPKARPPSHATLEQRVQKLVRANMVLKAVSAGHAKRAQLFRTKLKELPRVIESAHRGDDLRQIAVAQVAQDLGAQQSGSD
eukprot:9491602-Pyramimonas_sp.AAC.1